MGIQTSGHINGAAFLLSMNKIVSNNQLCIGENLSIKFLAAPL